MPSQSNKKLKSQYLQCNNVYSNEIITQYYVYKHTHTHCYWSILYHTICNTCVYPFYDDNINIVYIILVVQYTHTLHLMCGCILYL